MLSVQPKGTWKVDSRSEVYVDAVNSYVCDFGLGVDSDSCTSLGDGLRGKTWTLPFTMGDADGCSFAAEVKVAFSVGATMDGDEIADIIQGGIDQCASPDGGTISAITYNPGEDIAFTMFFGLICSAFGFGVGPCGNQGG